MPRLVTVLGATGIQGGSVVQALLADGTFSIRAITRNALSEAAQRLSVQGVQVVEADANSISSLQSAFVGSYAIFAATNFFEAFPVVGAAKAGEIESTQGINMAIAAANTPSLQHYIWSTLPNAERISNGQSTVAHYASKNKVDDYIKSNPALWAKTTFVWVAYYASNMNYPFWKPFPVPTAMKPDSYVQMLTTPSSVPIVLSGDTRHNVGLFVKAILQQPEKTLPGRFVLVATDTMTAGEVLNLWATAQGKEAEYVTVDKETYQRLWPMWGELMNDNFVYWFRAMEKTFSGEEYILTKDDLGVTGLIDTATAFSQLRI